MWNGYTNILYQNRLKQQVCKILDLYLSVYGFNLPVGVHLLYL